MSDGVTAGSDLAAPTRPRIGLALRVARLAAAGEHAEVCRMAVGATPAEATPGMIEHVLTAALETRDARALEWALAATSLVALRPRLRARIAWRLTRQQRPIEAFAVLTADPTLPDQADCMGLVASACASISISALAPEATRLAAAAITRRCLRVEDGGWTASSFVYPPQRPGPRLIPSGGVGLAAGVPAHATLEIRKALRRRARGIGGQIPSGSVVVYRDVLVDRWGRIWRRDGTVLHHEGPLAGRVPATDIPDAAVHDVAVLATGNTNNLYHWFGGTFPSLAFRFAPGGPDLPILIRTDSHPYHAESLRLVGGTDVPLLAVNEGAFVRELIVPRLRRGGGLGLHQGGAARPLFDRMVAASGPPEPGAPALRVFVSRRDAKARRTPNEEAIEQVYIDRGFTPVMMRDLALDARIRLMQRATAVGGAHGAGLTMVFAARPGTPVHEMLPWMPNTLPSRLCMAGLSAQFGLRHRLWVEPCDEARAAWAPQAGPLAADLDAFLARA